MGAAHQKLSQHLLSLFGDAFLMGIAVWGGGVAGGGRGGRASGRGDRGGVGGREPSQGGGPIGIPPQEIEGSGLLVAPELCSAYSCHLSPCVLFGLDALTVVLGPDRARLLAGGSYHLTNRADHELRILPLDEVAAVRIGDVLGVEVRGE